MPALNKWRSSGVEYDRICYGNYALLSAECDRVQLRD